jgi:hypothetical protein
MENWKRTKGGIFKNIKPSVRGWKAGFISDVTMLKHRVKKKDLFLFHDGLTACCNFGFPL